METVYILKAEYFIRGLHPERDSVHPKGMCFIFGHRLNCEALKVGPGQALHNLTVIQSPYRAKVTGGLLITDQGCHGGTSEDIPQGES